MSLQVIYHPENDSWWAESPDIKGWTAAANTFDEVSQLVREAVEYLHGEKVVTIDEYLSNGTPLLRG